MKSSCFVPIVRSSANNPAASIDVLFRPWPRIVAFRNILIHAYFGIDWDVVWRAATNRCPVLRGQVADILAADFGVQDGATAE